MAESNNPKVCLFCPCFLLLLLLDFPRNAVSQSMVRYLPGFDGPLPFELETGYVSVDDTLGVHLFYYFIKSEKNSSEDPLIIWFSGGPGCSSFSALSLENIGPLSFVVDVYNGSLPTLVLNPHSWTKVSNIIFVDAPVGTGFSYSTTVEGSSTGDTKSAKQSYIFIRKWLVDHQEFQLNPLYIAGDSYSGKTVPVVVQDILDGIEDGVKPLLNLKGYLLGNPSTDRNLEENFVIPFAYGMGLLSDELFDSTKKNCGGVYVNVDPSNVQCKKNTEAISKLLDDLYPYHILEPSCGLQYPYIIPSPPTFPRFGCREYGHTLSYYWVNDDRVLNTLNIRKGSIQEWSRCNYLVEMYHLNDVESSIAFYSNISKRHYRSLIYSGDHDMAVPSLSTQEWIRSLNYSISDDWRKWIVDDELAGYTRTYTNDMTFATIKGGGHNAAEYNPKQCFAMFKRWLSYEPL